MYFNILPLVNLKASFGVHQPAEIYVIAPGGQGKQDGKHFCLLQQWLKC